MSAKLPGVCHCDRQSQIGCSNAITQEDLLCDDCRAGCNSSAVQSDYAIRDLISGSYAGSGPHMRLTIREGDSRLFLTRDDEVVE